MSSAVLGASGTGAARGLVLGEERARIVPGERGSGSVLALALVGASLVLVGVLLAASALVVASTRLDATADAAALAAADAAAGWAPGDPCERAAAVATANGARVVACDLLGLVAVVEVASASGAPIVARARAGPETERGAADARGERASGGVPGRV